MDGAVLALYKQPDGKTLVAGQFTSFTPNGGAAVLRNNIARLNADGTVDTLFSPDTNGAVRAILYDSASKTVIIGGDFTTVGGNPHNYIARLKSDGSVDESFTASIGVSLDRNIALPTKPHVYALAWQSNAIVVGGTFGSASSAGIAAVQRNNIVRFASSSGALDTKYDPNTNAIVLALASYGANADQVILGGGFTSLKPNNGAAETRNHVARLNADGTLDESFATGTENGVTSIAVQRDNQILLGGYFNTVQSTSGGDSVAHSHIARVTSAGELDSTFTPSIGVSVNVVNAIGLTSDGSILVGGDFTQLADSSGLTATHLRIARLANDGTPDNSFSPNVNATVNAVVVDTDDKVIIGGVFTRIASSGSGPELIRNRIARIFPSGAVDADFNYDNPGRVLTSVEDSQGTVIGGTFSNIGGLTRYYLARMRADGTIDPSLNLILNEAVYALAYDAKNDTVIVGGNFTTIGYSTKYTVRSRIFRLNRDGTFDPNFDPNINGKVTSIVVVDDGYIIGGSFTAAQPAGTDTAVIRQNILKLTTAGQVDPTFNPNANGAVTTIVRQKDNKLLVGGAFTAMQPGASGTVFQRNYLARLNPDGSIDRDYNPTPVVPTGTAQVNAIAIQPSDGKAIVGGSFIGFLPPGATVAVLRSHVARINTDGSIDAKFDPNVSDTVLAIALQGDGKIILGGQFTQLAPNGATSPTDARYIARLNTDGTLDSTFDLGLNQQFGNRVDYLGTQASGDILVGGTFTSAQPPGSPVQPRDHLLRLLPTGALDSQFTVHPSGAGNNVIHAIAPEPGTKILVGGSFKDVGGAAGPSLGRFNSEGTPDFGFNGALSTNEGGVVNAIAIRPTAKPQATLLPGFSWLNPDGSNHNITIDPTKVDLKGRVNVAIQNPRTGEITIATTGNIVKLAPDGTQVAGYDVTVSGVYGMVLQKSDDSLIIYGQFTTVNGVGDNYIARINPDGTPDTTFVPNPDNYVYAAAVQDDGSIVFGGLFTTLSPPDATGNTSNSTIRNHLARVDAKGVIDTKFDPEPNSTVYAVTLQSDGKILIGGAFTAVNPPPVLATAPTRNYIARINSDGTLDTGFDPNANSVVVAIDVQSDQKIVIGGQFVTVGGVARNQIARLISDGTLDTSFTTSTNASVSYVKVAPDKSILIGGAFTNVTDTSGIAVARNHIAKLGTDGKLDPTFNPALNGEITSLNIAPQDSSVLIGGSFTETFATAYAIIGGLFSTVSTQAVPNLAEINADGSVVGTFQPNPDAAVNALLPLTDGSFFAGGAFTKIGQVPRPGLAHFGDNGQLDANFNPAITGTVSSLARQADGTSYKLIVGTDSGVVRLTPTGAIDASFHAPQGFVSAPAIAVQPDGRILVAGAPTSTDPMQVIRLNSDGSIDGTFTAFKLKAGETVHTLTLQTDGSVIVAGQFSYSSGAQTINNVVRLSSAGVVDSQFNPGPDDYVDALALESDGRLFLGGKFAKVGGLNRVVLARLGNSIPTSQSLTVGDDHTSILWFRSGASGEVEAVTFEDSQDGLAWKPLGTATWASGKWVLSNVTFDYTGNIFIRARGIVQTSAGKSTGVYESVIEYNTTTNTPSGVATVIGPVVTSTAWDQTHYVWTVDAAGNVRIADVYSLVTYNSLDSIPSGGGSGGGSNSSGSSRLANLSTRGIVGASSPLIGGFSIEGTQPRQVLIRAAGPGLAPFGVTDFLKVPKLVLTTGAGAHLAENTGWNASLTTTFARVGAFPFASGSTDAAFVITLNPGTYTAQVTDAGTGAGGDALIEIYDAGDLNDGSSRLANLSARASVTSAGTLISGLVVTGDAPKTMLIRGIGPSLAQFGVGGVLQDPAIAVYDARGAVMATNDNWSKSNLPTIAEAGYSNGVNSAANQVGAFSLATNSADAALVITLPVGTYTVQLTGVGGSAGAALIELYELP